MTTPTRTDFANLPEALRQGATEAEWRDPRWQLRHSFCTAERLRAVLSLTPEEEEALQQAGKRLAVRVTPYFLSLIDPDDPRDPLRLQVIPRREELLRHPEEMDDPCGEDGDMKAPGLVHRYPDRVLLLCTDRCATYCRYCTRSRLVSGVGKTRLHTDFEAAFAYLRQHTEVRDVLLSGGDPLLLPDERLHAILSRLQEIPHIEFLRVGTRVPIMLPWRITPALCAMLRSHAPLFLSIHCNHPRELTEHAEKALGMLADHGLPLGCQSVLLRGVNDDADTQMRLSHRLLQCRVRPYYLYQCDLAPGTRHFRTHIREGLRLISHMRGYTSGYAIPQYVVDAPGGGGKVPLNPDYIEELSERIARLHNYRGEAYCYPMPSGSGATPGHLAEV